MYIYTITISHAGTKHIGCHIVNTLLADTTGQRIARPIPLTCARISVSGVVETQADDERSTCAVGCGSTPPGTIERMATKSLGMWIIEERRVLDFLHHDYPPTPKSQNLYSACSVGQKSNQLFSFFLPFVSFSRLNEQESLSYVISSSSSFVTTQRYPFPNKILFHVLIGLEAGCAVVVSIYPALPHSQPASIARYAYPANRSY